MRSEGSNEGPGYQLNADSLRCLVGAGEDRPLDCIRLADEGESPIEVNRYFVECYRSFVDFKWGYVVMRFHHADDWEAIFRGHPDVFGTASV